MRKRLILITLLFTVALVKATEFVPGLLRDTFVGKWDATITPDDDALKASEHEFTDTLAFKGGQFTSTTFQKRGFPSTSYSEDTRMGDIGMFTAVQTAADKSSVKWSGTVSVDQLTGDLTWTKKDGSALHYTIKATKQ